jgi:hypothetical protein
MAGARRFLLAVALVGCAHRAPPPHAQQALAPRDCAAAARACRGERGCCAEPAAAEERRCADAARQCARCNALLGGCRSRGLGERDCRVLLASCWDERPPPTLLEPRSP